MQFLTPEEREVAQRSESLKTLVETLSERELEVTTLKNDLNHFRQRYAQRVGRLYAELDRLDALLAKRRAESDPAPDKQREANDALAQARKSAIEAGLPPPESLESELPILAEVTTKPSSDELKQLYRRAAMRFHPDRATTDKERERRTVLMAQLNVSYANGDLQAIKDMLEREGSDPEEITGDDVGSQLIRLIRREAQVRRRLAELESELRTLTADESYELWQKVLARESIGGDPMGEIAAQVEAGIAQKRAILAAE
jgi:hypothetical protein